MYIPEQYSTDGVEPPPQRTLDRSREGPRMDERGTGSCASCMRATAGEGDSGVAELSVASHYSESANNGPPHNPPDVVGVPPPTVPTAENELSAQAVGMS